MNNLMVQDSSLGGINIMIDKQQELKMKEHINYMSVDYSTSHWTSLEMILNYVKLRPYDKEEIILHLENTIKEGYVLINSESLGH